MTDAATGLGNVRALQPARVALTGRDKRFIKVASFLLARRGFEVSHAASDTELTQLLDNQTIDVVVLDASVSLSGSLRTAAALSAVYPNLRIILATERRDSGVASTYTQIDKWRGLGVLPDEIVRAYLGLDAETPSPLQAS
jgi:ActR/RegA family two-component response regulator